jgi:hypothetical protein
MSRPEPAPMQPRRFWLYAPWACFLALAIGWMFYWNAVADAGERALLQWKGQIEREGGEARYVRLVRHGFPVLMRLELDDVRYEAPHAHWSAASRQVDVNIEMLDPGHVIFEYKAPITITHADGHTNTIIAAKAVVSLHNRGSLMVQDGAEASELSVGDSANPGLLRVVHVTANVRTDPGDAANDQLAFSAQGVSLARPVRSFEGLGQIINNLEAGIVIEHAEALQGVHGSDPFAPWREAGGKARIEYLNLTWGALEATGSGEAALDEAHRLTGDLRLDIPRPDAPIAALAASSSLAPDAKQALQLLALGLSLRGRHAKLKIDASDGQLRVEHQRVRSLDPLY